MSELKPAPCPWCKQMAREKKADLWHWVACTSSRCLAGGPTRKSAKSAITEWNKVAEAHRGT